MITSLCSRTAMRWVFFLCDKFSQAAFRWKQKQKKATQYTHCMYGNEVGAHVCKVYQQKCVRTLHVQRWPGSYASWEKLISAIRFKQKTKNKQKTKQQHIYAAMSWELSFISMILPQKSVHTLHVRCCTIRFETQTHTCVCVCAKIICVILWKYNHESVHCSRAVMRWEFMWQILSMPFCWKNKTNKQQKKNVSLCEGYQWKYDHKSVHTNLSRTARKWKFVLV